MLTKYVVVASCWLVAFWAAAPAAADQQVKLKSGATLIGSVAVAGSEVVVTMDDAQLRVPLEDVTTISGEDGGGSGEARRLLVAALEARVLNGPQAEVSGLLSEAARLAPDDPQIAYWHAASLADAGFGTAAREAFEANRDRIEKLFPGRAAQLDARIQRRIALETLPEPLVRRLDQVNQDRSSRAPSPGDDYVDRYVAFQLVDQHKQPVEASEFRIVAGGDNERLETFDDGHYLFYFRRRVNSKDDSCKILIGGVGGLRAETFNLHANSGQVTPAGKFAAHRYGESDKRNLEVQIVDRQGAPIAGASAALQAKPENGGPMVSGVQVTADDQGVAKFRAHPMRYYLRASAEGYQLGGITVNLPDGGDNVIQRRAILDKSIPASVRVEWCSTPRQPPDAPIASGAVALRPFNHLSPSYTPFSPDTPQWIRLVQFENQLRLHLHDLQFRAPSAGSTSWVRLVPEDARLVAGDQSPETPADRFAAIELAKLEQIKEKLEPVEPLKLGPGTVPAGLQQLPVSEGAIYVGKLAFHDHRNGQLCDISFKAWVEQAGEQGAAAEKKDEHEQPAIEPSEKESPEADEPEEPAATDDPKQ